MERNATFVGQKFDNSCGNSIRAAAKLGRKFAHEFADTFGVYMEGSILSTTVKEKDLGVTMNANMKVSEQCRIAASKGNQVLGMIRRNI